MLIALAAVVAAVALIALGVGGGLSEAAPDRLDQPLPPDRALDRADIDTLRLPLAVRGYRMAEVDDVLDRVAAEIAYRDARIAELEGALARERAAAAPGPVLTKPEPRKEPCAHEPQDAAPRPYGDNGRGQ